MPNALFLEKTIDTSSLKNDIIKPDTVITVLSACDYPQIPSAPEDKKFIRSLLSAIFRYDPDRPMIFTTAAFWLFFLMVLAGYSLVYRKLMIRNVYLFLISLFFYYKAGGLFLFILIFVTVVDYTCGLLLNKSERVAVRRLIVLLSLISNLGLLGYFKYTGFIISSINEIFGTQLKVYDLLSSVLKFNPRNIL